MKTIDLYWGIYRFFHFIVFILLTQLASLAQSNSLFIQGSSISSSGAGSSTNRLYLNQSAGQPSGYTQTASFVSRIHQGFVSQIMNDVSTNSETFQCLTYPNPTNGLFYVTTDSPIHTSFSLSLLDVKGKLVGKLTS